MTRGVLRVLGAHRQPTGTTNPYLTQLTSALADHAGVDYRTFTFPRALGWSYDVIHLHWPEVVMGGHRRLGRASRQALTALLILRLRVRRTAVVRTLHNLEVPSDASPTERYLIRRLDALTVSHVLLTAHGAPADRAATVIPHGHYVDWFAGRATDTSRPGHAVFVGLVRRYKGVEDLVRVFTQIEDDGVSLGIHGRPSSPALAAEIDALASSDPRISTHWGFLDDAAMVATVSRSELVVLPYRVMHNSGVVLMALSLGRPVLVPDTPVNRDLAAEVGAGWVRTFSDGLTTKDVTDALAAGVPTGSPCLDDRGWSDAAERHVEVYHQARRVRRGVGEDRPASP